MRTGISSCIVGGACTLLFASCNFASFRDWAFQPLEFPFADPGDIVRLAAFGIPNWSGTEPHNGMDLIVDERLTSTRILSPTAGVVRRIDAHENPYSPPPGQLIVTVEIRVNSEWTVYLVLEPGSADPETRTAQLAAILVNEGQEVGVGTPVADLLIGTLGYPHLHYWLAHNGEAVCAYSHSSDAARAAIEAVATQPGSHLPDGNICYGQP